MFFLKKNTHSFYFCWNIDLNLLKSLIQKNGESYQSGVFKRSDKFWFSFSLKPNEHGAIWIYFNCFSGHEEVKAVLNFKARCSGHFFSAASKKLECNFATSSSQGIELIDHKKLLSYESTSLEYPEFHIRCNAAITFKPYKCENCFLGKKLFNSDAKDLKIISGDKKEIMVHKTILSTFSPIFSKMIDVQSNDGNDAIIEIPDCDYDILKSAVDFCYGISGITSSDIDDLIKLLEFSAKYEFNDLKKEMEFKLMPQITNKNICKLSNIAFTSEALKALCQSKLAQYIKENDATVMKDIDSIKKEFVEAVFQNVCVKQGYFDLSPFLEFFFLGIPVILVVILFILLMITTLSKASSK